jgi:hypothetical protein
MTQNHSEPKVAKYYDIYDIGVYLVYSIPDWPSPILLLKT